MAAQQLVANDQHKAPEPRDVYQLIGLLNGYTGYGQEVTLTALDSDTAYSQVIRNLGTGGHLEAQRSYDGATILAVTDTGVTISLALTVATLRVTGNALIDGTLGVTGATTLGVLGAGATTVTTLTATGNVALGDANTDTQTLIGISQWRNAASTQFPLQVNVATNQVLVGAVTTLAAVTAPNLQTPRLYVAPEADNDSALQIRRSVAAAVGATLGINATSDLVVKDVTDTEVIRLGAAASAYQLYVTGKAAISSTLNVTGVTTLSAKLTVSVGGADITGTLAVTGGITATTSIAATGGMSAGASSSFTGGVSLPTGVLNVQSGRAIAQTFEANGTGAVLVASGASQYQTTIGVAGGASALPALPVAYVKVTVAGSNYCFPIYNV